APCRSAGTRRDGGGARSSASPRPGDAGRRGRHRRRGATPRLPAGVRGPPRLRCYPPPVSTILVTGAGGFVGSHLVPALVGAGHPVVALSRTEASGQRVLDRLAPGDRTSVEV